MPRADGSILIKVDVDAAESEKELGKLKKSIRETEEEIEDLGAEKAKASEKSVFSAAELDKEKAKLAQMKSELEEIRAISKDTSLSKSVRAEAEAAIPDRRSEVSDQQARVTMLQTEYNKLDAAVQRYDEKLEKARKSLDKQVERAGELTKQINAVSKGSRMMAQAQEKAQKSLQRFGMRFNEVIRSALVFTVMSQAFSALRKWMGQVIQTNDEARQSVAELKGALLTLAQPLVDVIIPAFTAFVNILTKVVATAAQLVSFLFGKTAKQSAEAAEALNKETQALEGVGGAADDAAGSLAGFDEINVLNTDRSGGASAGEIAPSFDFDTSMTTENMENLLGWIEAIGAALLGWRISSAFMLGLKETIGLAMGIYFAFQFVKSITDAWANGVTWDNLLSMLLSLTGAAVGFGIAFGPIGAGIALVVGGLAMLATGFHDAYENGWNLQNLFTSIAGILATGIGIGLLTGSWIPLLIAGIASLLLAFTVATGHGDELISGMRKTLEGFKDFFTGIFVGDVEKAIGGIDTTFEGLKESVGAVIGGVEDTLLGFLDWLDEKTDGKFSKIIEIIKTLVAGGAEEIKKSIGEWLEDSKLILQEVVLFLNGVFTQDWDQAWESLKKIVKEYWDDIMRIVEFAKDPIGSTLDWLLEKLDLFSRLKELLNPSSVRDGSFGSSSSGSFGGTTAPGYSVPALATGAVVPPNREFMAILGDNKTETEIVSPLSTMKQAVLEALRESGGLGGGTVTVVVNLDGKEVARNQVKHINDMTRQAGKPVLLY